LTLLIAEQWPFFKNRKFVGLHISYIDASMSRDSSTSIVLASCTQNIISRPFIQCKHYEVNKLMQLLQLLRQQPYIAIGLGWMAKMSYVDSLPE
jgi:hypothetical protein